MKSPQEITI